MKPQRHQPRLKEANGTWRKCDMLWHRISLGLPHGRAKRRVVMIHDLNGSKWVKAWDAVHEATLAAFQKTWWLWLFTFLMILCSRCPWCHGISFDVKLKHIGHIRHIISVFLGPCDDAAMAGLGGGCGDCHHDISVPWELWLLGAGSPAVEWQFLELLA